MKQNFGEHFDLHIKSNLTPEKKEVEAERVPTRLEMERRETAQEIARSGDFENILRTLEERILLDEHIDRLHEKYYADLESADFLTDQDWKVLAVLELYDTGTFLHSLETYRIAKDKIEKGFVFEGVEIRLDEMIKKEGLVSLEQFYRACLLHDIGKVEVPHFIITSEITHAEWAEILVNFDKRNSEEKLLENVLAQSEIIMPQDIAEMPDGHERDARLVKLLTDNGIRCEKHVPIEEALNNPLLSDRAYSEKDMANLESRNLPGISGKSSVFDVIKTHEKTSFNILNNLMKLEKEAALAGAHHDYDELHAKMIEQYPYTVSSFHISSMLAEFLSISDMFQAIKNKRTYKNAESQLETMDDLIDNVNAKNNPNLSFMAYVWVGSDFASLKASSLVEHARIAKLRVKLGTLSKKIEGFKKGLEMPPAENF